jgi:hypothetical protein
MKNLLLLTYGLMLTSISFAQLGKINIQVGYEALLQSKKTITGSTYGAVKTFKEYTFSDEEKGDLAQIRTGLVHSPTITISYPFSERFEMSFSFKNYYRRYSLRSSYLNTETGKYEIMSYAAFSGIGADISGPITRVSSKQLWAIFYPKFLEFGKTKIGFASSINIDNYHRNLEALFAEKRYSIGSTTIDGTDTLSTQLDVLKFGSNTNYYELSLPSFTFNHGIVIRQKFTDHIAMEANLGYRNIHWDFLMPTDKMNISYDMSFREYTNGNQTTFSTITQTKFPIEIGGWYINTSLVWNPKFRTANDKPEKL